MIFGAKEIREQTEAGTTAKLLIPRCDLAPVLHPSSLEFSVNLPRGEWGVEGSTSKAEPVIGKHGTVEGEGRKAECGGQNIWGSETNTGENSGFPHVPIVSKNEKHILY